MTRDEKIQAIKDIKNGMPARFALNRRDYMILQRNRDEDFYYASNGTIVTKDEVSEYLTDSFIFINGSDQFRIGEGGKAVEVTTGKADIVKD